MHSVIDVYLCIFPFGHVWQLKIQNDFDPVLSPESSLFVLKSKKQVNIQLHIPTFPVFTPGRLVIIGRQINALYLMGDLVRRGDCLVAA